MFLLPLDQNSYSPNHLASLFEMNASAIDDDIGKIPTPNKTQEHQFDENNMEGFTLETENSLKMLDATSTLNRNSIFNDFDRLRKWQEANEKSEDETNKNLFLSKSPDSLFQSEENNGKSACPHGINLLLDPFASIVDGDDKFDSNLVGEDRLKQLEERMNESDFVSQSTIFDIHSSDHKTEPKRETSNEIPVDSNEYKQVEIVDEKACSSLDDLLDLPDDPTEIVQMNADNKNFSLELPPQDGTMETVDDVINSFDTQETDQLLDLASSITHDFIDQSISQVKDLELPGEESIQTVDHIELVDDDSNVQIDLGNATEKSTSNNDHDQLDNIEVLVQDESSSENDLKENLHNIEGIEEITDGDMNEDNFDNAGDANTSLSDDNINISLEVVHQTNNENETDLTTRSFPPNNLSGVSISEPSSKEDLSLKKNDSGENIAEENNISIKDGENLVIDVKNSITDDNKDENSSENKIEIDTEETVDLKSIAALDKIENQTIQSETLIIESGSSNEISPVGFEEGNAEINAEDFEEMMDDLERDITLSEEASSISQTNFDDEQIEQNSEKISTVDINLEVDTIKERSLNNKDEERENDNTEEGIEDNEESTIENVAVHTLTIQETSSDITNQLDVVSNQDDVDDTSQEESQEELITEASELRTSLRREGGSSASGRRVRFSLEPDYQSAEENSNETDSNTPGNQETENQGNIDLFLTDFKSIIMSLTQFILHHF